MDSEKRTEETKEQAEKRNRNSNLWILISLAFLVLIFGITTFVSGSKGKEKDVQERSVTLTDAGFDTPVTFQATASEDDYMTYLNIVKDVFRENNQLFDQYSSYEDINNIRTLNEEAADHPVTVDSRIIEVLEMSEEAEKINPKFDIAEGKLLALWHDERESDDPEVPDSAAIEKAKVHTGTEGITISGNEISFADDSISLDLGAIAKGYTAQMAKEKLQEAGLNNGFINAGGNVVLIGDKPDGSDWVIGIQEPDSNDSLVRLSFSEPVSMVTSGDYQRYFEVDGKRYSHIIDPDTGYPAEYVRSVTVIDDDSGWADAMSTVLFCMPLEEGLKTAEENGLEAVWIVDKGTSDLEPVLSNEEFDIYCTEGLVGNLHFPK